MENEHNFSSMITSIILLVIQCLNYITICKCKITETTFNVRKLWMTMITDPTLNYNLCTGNPRKYSYWYYYSTSSAQSSTWQFVCKYVWIPLLTRLYTNIVILIDKYISDKIYCNSTNVYGTVPVSYTHLNKNSSQNWYATNNSIADRYY